MTEQYMKQEYCAIEPSEELKGRVLAACRAAKRKHTAMRRRITSAAACFAVVLVLSVYGLSPVPGISAGGEYVDDGIMNVSTEVILTPALQRTVSPDTYGLQTAAVVEEVEGCVCLKADQKVTINASEGVLYTFDPAQDLYVTVETPYHAKAYETLYWCGEGENAQIKIRSGIRTVTLNLTPSADGWTLEK